MEGNPGDSRPEISDFSEEGYVDADDIVLSSLRLHLDQDIIQRLRLEAKFRGVSTAFILAVALQKNLRKEEVLKAINLLCRDDA